MRNLNLNQLTLDFPHLPSLGRDDFMVADCNSEAVKLIDSWPQWAYFAVCIYGPEGCGKTHLANVFANKVANLTHYPYRIPFIKAKQISLTNFRSLFNRHSCLVIEELSAEVNQEALFHLYNLYRDEGGNILFTSAEAPARLNFSLPDLRSRMNIVPAAAINEPDDDLLSALYVKLFNDRQIIPSPEIINYILNNTPRSFAYARKLVAEIDDISLSCKRAITLPIVKEAISSLAHNDYAQGNLFGWQE